MTCEEALKLLNRTDCEGCEYYVPFGCEKCYEAGQLGAKALEHQQKYRWHDLRENPDDRPHVETDFLVVTGLGHYRIAKYWDGVFVFYYRENNEKAIAWKYIEPFEG